VIVALSEGSVAARDPRIANLVQLGFYPRSILAAHGEARPIDWRAQFRGLIRDGG
jgi:hypothetical protein